MASVRLTAASEKQIDVRTGMESAAVLSQDVLPWMPAPLPWDKGLIFAM